MRTLLFFLLFAAFAFGADIDAKLYEGGDREAYYLQIRQQIDAAQSLGTLSKADADDERAALERLRRASGVPPPVERDEAALLPQTVLMPQHAVHALQTAASIRVKADAAARTLKDIRAKLAFLKQSIERMTSDEKVRLFSLQLQFAYYKLQQKNMEERSGQLQQYGDAVTSALEKHLPALRCDDTKAARQERMAKIQAAVEEAQRQKVAAEIALERAELEGSGLGDALREKQAAAKEAYGRQLEKKLELQSQSALCMLTTKADKSFFSLLDEMDAAAAQLTKELRPQYAAQDAVLRDLAKARFGVTTLVLGDTLHETKALFATIGRTVSEPLFVYKETAISVLSLVKALLILIAGFAAGVFYKRRVAQLAKRWPDMSQMSMRLASNIGYYLIVIIAVMIAVSSLGIDMTSISLIAGALSIGVGFGLQTVVSNFIAGIILMFERTIRIGDTIEISGELRGRVTDMRIRSTTIKTFDNIDIVVPNSSFIQNNVINWTLEDVTRRIHIPFSVAYGTEVDAVKRAVLDELEASSLIYIRNDPEKQPEVWMVNMNSSSVDFELLVWIEWANKYRPNALRSDFLILIYNALYKHGIQIPFPQLDLYVKQMPKAES